MRAVEHCSALLKHLENSQPARNFETDDESKAILVEMMLLTNKPILYVCNVDEKSFPDGNNLTRAFEKAIEGEPAEIILICAGIEADIAALDSVEERKEFLEAMGLEEPGVNRLIRKSYQLLNLVTYFTAGEKKYAPGLLPKERKLLELLV